MSYQLLSNPGVLIACVLLVFALVAWTGWRFFYAVPVSGVGSGEVGNEDICEPAPPKPRWRPWQNWTFTLPTLNRRVMIWAFLPLLLILMVVSCVFFLARKTASAPLVVQKLAQEGDVRARLNLERLLPPPPLPPSIFVGTGRLQLETADRDWAKLNPEFMQTILRLFNRMEKRGYPLALLEGYRSTERQDKLAAMGPHVTHAKGGQSKHAYGFAVDVAPMKNGKLIISERDSWAFEAYQVLGEESRAMGLIWGGAWAMRDYGHVEAAQKVSTMKLLRY